jgi:glutamine amidotransferase
MIAIIDYGMGNLRSVAKALERVGAQTAILNTPDRLDEADKLVLPGVGAFQDAMTHLQERGFVEPLRAWAAGGKPFLGICLGLQLLFDVSFEDGQHAGLGILPGKVVRFDMSGRPERLKVPHMGWNQVRFVKASRLTAGLEQGSYFYFVHSYYVEPADPDAVLGVCDYGAPFTAMVEKGNIFATQCHPEKSQNVGRKLLENFARLS